MSITARIAAAAIAAAIALAGHAPTAGGGPAAPARLATAATATLVPLVNPPAMRTFNVYGDSITENGGAAGWVALVRGRLAAAGITNVTLVNRAVGGTCYDSPGARSIKDLVLSDLANNAAPYGMLFVGGTNDMVNHTTSTLGASKWDLIDIDVAAAAAGVTARWYATVPALTTGTAVPAGWLPALVERRADMNAWLRTMWGPGTPAAGAVRLYDLAGVMLETGGVAAAGTTVDGLHPTAATYVRWAAAADLTMFTS